MGMDAMPSTNEELLNEMNLRVIRRNDSEATHILKSATHVTTYSFNEEDQSWSKIGVEGPFFIYKRYSHPHDDSREVWV